MASVRPTLAVDIDEVLGMFVHSMCTFVNGKSNTSWKADDFVSYHFADVWKCSDEEVCDFVFVLRATCSRCISFPLHLS